MFRTSEVKKTYWAVVKNAPQEPEGELVHFLVRNEKQNKSYAYDKEVPNSKKAILHYRLIGHSENYYLLEVDLKPDVIIRFVVSWQNGMPYQGRFEIWLSTLQSGWEHLSACPESTVHTSCLKRTDRA